ncbi:hypothetical protein D6D17_07605 [Aureobasidium pullulans]|nr:hypothetical protein D6D17_07605 [Aureobasidium pullulans]
MPPGAPALHRGLARPSALTSQLSTSVRPISPLLPSYSARSYAVPSRQRAPFAAVPVANAHNVRQELENARKGSQTLVTRNASPSGISHTERKNFLARLTSWMPLFDRLQNSLDAFSTFRHEADVCDRLPAPKDAETRLIDEPQYLQNLNLWLEILRFRLRLDGQQGVMDVVEAFVRRQVVLPLRGPQADQLWSILLWSAIQYPQMLRLLYPYVFDTLPRSGLLDICLYHRIVGPLLRQNPMFAVKWHKRMQIDGLLPSDHVSVLAHFVEDVCMSNHKPKAIEAFKKIYTSLKVKYAYDECMLHICRMLDFPDALDMHVFFVRHDDKPSLSMKSTPVIAHLIEHTWLAKSGMKPSVRDRFADQIMTAQYEFQRIKPIELDTAHAEVMPALTRENMSTLVGDVHNIREKELNDAFCARLFATTAFSTDLIITGLRMLGLKVVGNLALREIAARVSQPLEYVATVDAIRNAGISVVDSVFSRALQSFAKQPGKHRSFEFLVSSDQHPTAYEDRSLQKQLFGSFLASGDHTQANAVLDVLTVDEAEPQTYHANLILQAYSRRGQRASILQILHEMRLHRIPVSEASLRTIQWTTLRPRLRSKRPITQEHHNLPGALDEGDRHPLNTIFTPHLLRAMVAWGFKSEVSSPESTTAVRLGSEDLEAQSKETEGAADESFNGWTRGLVLVRKLQRFGVNLRGTELRREVKLRLWTLYGPGRSTVPLNRQAQRMNRLSLVDRVNHIHRIMGTNWLRLPPEVRGQSDVSQWTMYRALFGQPRRMRRRTQKDRG